MREALARLGSGRDAGTRRDPIAAIERATGTSIRITSVVDGTVTLDVRRGDDEPFTLAIEVGATVETDAALGPPVAATELDTAGRSARTTLSQHTKPEHILRAIAHEVRESAIMLIDGQTDNSQDLLDRNVTPPSVIAQHSTDQWQSFSPHDHGRLAELRLLLDAYAATPRWLGKNALGMGRAQLRAEIAELIHALGLEFRGDATVDTSRTADASQSAAAIRLRAIASSDLKQQIREFNISELEIAPRAVPSLTAYYKKQIWTAAIPGAARLALALLNVNALGAMIQLGLGATVNVFVDRLKDQRSADAKAVGLTATPRTAVDDVSDNSTKRDARVVRRQLDAALGAQLAADPKTQQEVFGATADQRREALLRAQEEISAAHDTDRTARAEDPDSIPERTTHDESERLGSRNAIRLKAAAGPTITGLVWLGFSAVAGWTAPIVAYIGGQFAAAVAGMRGDTKIEEFKQAKSDALAEEQSRLQVRARDIVVAEYDARISTWMRTDASEKWQAQDDLAERLQQAEADLAAGRTIDISDFETEVPGLPGVPELSIGSTDDPNDLGLVIDEELDQTLDESLRVLDRAHNSDVPRFRPLRRRAHRRSVQQATQSIDDAIRARGLGSDRSNLTSDELARRARLTGDVRAKLDQFQSNPTRPGRSAVADFRTFLWARGPASIFMSVPATALFAASMVASPIVVVGAAVATIGAGLLAARTEQLIERRQERARFADSPTADPLAIDAARLHAGASPAAYALQHELQRRQDALQARLDELRARAGMPAVTHAALVSERTVPDEQSAQDPAQKMSEPAKTTTDEKPSPAEAPEVRRAYWARFPGVHGMQAATEAAMLTIEAALGLPSGDSNSASALGRGSSQGASALTAWIGERNMKIALDHTRGAHEGGIKKALTGPERDAAKAAIAVLRDPSIHSDLVRRAVMAAADFDADIRARGSEERVASERIETARRDVAGHVHELDILHTDLSSAVPTLGLSPDLRASLDTLEGLQAELAQLRTGEEHAASIRQLTASGDAVAALVQARESREALRAALDPANPASVASVRERLHAVLTELAPALGAIHVDLSTQTQQRLTDTRRRIDAELIQATNALLDQRAATLQLADQHAARSQADDSVVALEAVARTLRAFGQSAESIRLGAPGNPSANWKMNAVALRRVLDAHEAIIGVDNGLANAQRQREEAQRLGDAALADALATSIDEVRAASDALVGPTLENAQRTIESARSSRPRPAGLGALESALANVREQHRIVIALAAHAELAKADAKSALDADSARDARSAVGRLVSQSAQAADELASSRAELDRLLTVVQVQQAQAAAQATAAQIRTLADQARRTAATALHDRNQARHTSLATGRRERTLLRSIDRAARDSERAASAAQLATDRAARLVTEIALLASDAHLQPQHRPQVRDLAAELDRELAQAEQHNAAATTASELLAADARAVLASIALQALRSDARQLAKTADAQTSRGAQLRELLERLDLSSVESVSSGRSVAEFAARIGTDLEVSARAVARLDTQLTSELDGLAQRDDETDAAAVDAKVVRAGEYAARLRAETDKLRQLSSYGAAAVDVARVFEQTAEVSRDLARAVARAESVDADAAAITLANEVQASRATSLASQAVAYGRSAQRRVEALARSLDEAATYLPRIDDHPMMARLVADARIDLQLARRAIADSLARSSAARDQFDDTPRATDPQISGQPHAAVRATARIMNEQLSALVADADTELAVFAQAEASIAAIAAITPGRSDAVDAAASAAMADAVELQRQADLIESQLRAATEISVSATTAADRMGQPDADAQLEAARVAHAADRLAELEATVRAHLGDVAHSAGSLMTRASVLGALDARETARAWSESASDTARRARASVEVARSVAWNALDDVRVLDADHSGPRALRAAIDELGVNADLLGQREADLRAAHASVEDATDRAVVAADHQTAHAARDEATSAAQSVLDAARLLDETAATLHSQSTEIRSSATALHLTELRQRSATSLAQLHTRLDEAAFAATMADRAARLAADPIRGSAETRSAVSSAASRAQDAVDEAGQLVDLLERQSRVIAELTRRNAVPEGVSTAELAAAIDELVSQAQTSIAAARLHASRSEAAVLAVHTDAARASIADIGAQAATLLDRLRDEAARARLNAHTLAAADDSPPNLDQLVDDLAATETRLHEANGQLDALAAKAAAAVHQSTPDIRGLNALQRQTTEVLEALQQLQAQARPLFGDLGVPPSPDGGDPSAGSPQRRAHTEQQAQLWRIIRSGITIGELPEELRYLLRVTPPPTPNQPEQPPVPPTPRPQTPPPTSQPPGEQPAKQPPPVTSTPPETSQTPPGPSAPAATPGTDAAPPTESGEPSTGCTPLPPVGADAVETAIDAARRAAERVGGIPSVTAADEVRIELPGGQSIVIRFDTGEADADDALVVTRDGDTIVVRLNTRAAASDISVEIAAGVTMAILYAYGITDAPSVLTPDADPTGVHELGLTDRQKVAVLAELIYQWVYAEPGLKPAAAVALNAQIDAMGLDLDSGPESALARRELLPRFVYNDLAKFIPDWNSNDPQTAELDDAFAGDECIAEHAEAIRTVDEDEFSSR